MVSPEIPHQARLFLLSVTAGIGMLFVYDLFRIFRRVARHGTLWIAIEDMLFWVGCAFGMFGFLYRQNDGSVRGFVILGALFGMILYRIGCSKQVVRIGTAVLAAVVKAARRILRIVSTPFRIAGRGIGQSAGNAGRFCKKRGRSLKKRLKKIGKVVKMGIYKL